MDPAAARPAGGLPAGLIRGEAQMEMVLATAISLGALAAFELLALRFGVSSRDGEREVWW